MDAIILAGGRGRRMRGVAAEFQKPLLPIDGVPLICRAVDLAYAAGVEMPVIVVAPENVNQIDEVLGPNRDAAFVIQRQPYGPGHALMLGLQMRTRPTPSNRVLVLLSDNISTIGDVNAVATHQTAVGVREFNADDAVRFTQLIDGRWSEDKTRRPGLNRTAKMVECWVGPFVGWRDHMEAVLHNRWNDNFDVNVEELLIGPYLDLFMHDQRVHAVPVSSYDVGTLDAYLGVEK